MIDLHCHLLPGLDDGPEHLEDSVQMCRMASEDGITHAIVTPHIHPGRWDNSTDAVRAALGRLSFALSQENIELQLGYAAEVRLTDTLVRQVTQEQIPFLGECDGYRIMLLELPHGHVPPGSEKLVAWLVTQGIRPLIAHPERNKQLMKDVSGIYPLIELGCWLQITGGSVLGQFGQFALATAEHLLRENLVTVVASDAHNLRARPPLLRQAFRKVEQCFGFQRAQRLFVDNPHAISIGQFPNAGEFSSIAVVQ